MANTKKAEATEVAEQTTQAEAKAEEKEAKVYNFKSANKFLSVSGLGVQFINGAFSTSKLEVAKKLVKIDGVELVEE